MYGANNESLSFDLAVPLWGESFTKLFLEIILPSWLSFHNLFESAKTYSITVKFFTTKATQDQIKNHSIFRTLANICDTTFNCFINEQKALEKKYETLSACHQLAWKEAVQKGSSLLLFPVDCLIADGGIMRCCSLLSKGYKVVASPTLCRSSKEKMLLKLAHTYSNNTDHCLTISNRELISLGLQCLHPDVKYYFWKSHFMSAFPSMFYWKVGKESLLGKFFHLHPLAIHAKIQDEIDLISLLSKETIDSSLSGRVLEKDLYMVTSTDDIAIVDLTNEKETNTDPLKPKLKSFSLARFSQRACLSSQRVHFMNFNFRYQSHEEVDWLKIEKKANRNLLLYRLLVKGMVFLRPFVLKIKKCLNNKC